MKLNLLNKVMEYGTTKEKSIRIIRSGQVKVNDVVTFIPSEQIKETDKIIITKSPQWVSRGALKLLKAIEAFNLNFQNKVVLDIGSSTGGFSHVALAFGAKEVNALDVGTNQLAYKIRTHPKVNVFEKTNLKIIKSEMFVHKIDIVVSDVSFISLKHVFHVCKNLGDSNLLIMALIKPQFEVNSDQVQSGGYVSPTLHKEVLEKIKFYAKNNNFKVKYIYKSSILGKKSKNIEYISLFERNKDE